MRSKPRQRAPHAIRHEQVVRNARDLFGVAPRLFQRAQFPLHGAPFRVLIHRHLECESLGVRKPQRPELRIREHGARTPPLLVQPRCLCDELLRRARRGQMLDGLVDLTTGSAFPIQLGQELTCKLRSFRAARFDDPSSPRAPAADDPEATALLVEGDTPANRERKHRGVRAE